MSAILERIFPRLVGDYQVTSPATAGYNCIAWAAGDETRWWWPDEQPDVYWPSGVPRELTIVAFIAVFRTMGYEVCASGELERGCEKVALYALNDVPTHAARQLPSGRWTSKAGIFEDLEHSLEGLEGDLYGRVVCLLRRRQGAGISRAESGTR